MVGKQDVERTCRILIKILNEVPYKQIAYEEGVSPSKITFTKNHYIREKVSLELNTAGLALMNGAQLDLLMEAERKSRNEILRRLGKDRTVNHKKSTWDQGI